MTKILDRFSSNQSNLVNMFQFIKSMRCSITRILVAISIFLTLLIKGSDQFELEWVTPPPPVVVADIGEVYRIGCRLTLNTSDISFQNLSVDIHNVQLSAYISQVLRINF